MSLLPLGHRQLVAKEAARRRQRNFQLWAVALLAPLFFACTRVTGLVDLRTAGFDHLSAAETQHLLDSLAAQRVERARIHAIGRVKRGLAGEEFRQVVVFSYPHKLRVEIFSTALNQLTGIVTADAGEMRAFDLAKRQYLRGSVSLRTASHLLTVPFLPGEFMLWLLGRYDPPPASRLVQASGFRSPTGDQSILRLHLRDNRTIALALDRDQKLQAFEMATPTGKVILSSRYVRDGSLTEIEFALPERNLSGKLSLQQVATEIAPPPDALFQLFFPTNATVEDLG